ncbi:ATP-binding protein [Yinghuangia aomiensis]
MQPERYHLPSLRRDLLAHLATGTFVAKAENVILLGPPGIGKTHLAIGLGVKATQASYSVLFDTASNWISRLAEAHHSGPPGGRAEEDPPLQADHRRRGRLHPVRPGRQRTCSSSS